MGISKHSETALPQFDFPLTYLAKCRSTNDQIVDLLSAENSVPQALYTLDQTQGKGQYGNSWECPAGQNLAYSLALPTNFLSAQPQILNYHTALGVAQFLAKLTNVAVHIKWPNDLIIGGKKVGGILIEQKKVAGENFYIIGIGLNILQENFPNLPKAGSLRTQTGQSWQPGEVAAQLHHFLGRHFSVEISAEAVLDAFNQKLFRKNTVSVFSRAEVRQNGIIKYADADGFLWIELENEGLQKFFHKEIELLY